MATGFPVNIGQVQTSEFILADGMGTALTPSCSHPEPLLLEVLSMSHRFKQLDSRAYCLDTGSSLGLPTLNLGPDLHATGDAGGFPCV